MGYDPQLVDAGYEWVGSHATSTPSPGSNDYGLTWDYDAVAIARPCAIVSNSPLADDDLTLIRVDHSAYRRYLFVGFDEPLYLYGSNARGCPPPPAVVGTIEWRTRAP